MSLASIALNRFGYGLAAGDSPPRNPEAWLLRQLEAFDPAPPAIATRATTRGKTAEPLETLRSFRAQV